MRRKEPQAIVLERLPPESGVMPLGEVRRQQIEAIREALLDIAEEVGCPGRLGHKKMKRKSPFPGMTAEQDRSAKFLLALYKQMREDIKQDIHTYRELRDLSSCSEEELKQIAAERAEFDE